MARSPKLPKVKRGELRYVMVTHKRTGKSYKTLTSVLPGTGFPVIYESPSNLHRKGEKGGMLLTHDKIVKGEVHASREHFMEAYRRLKKLENSQGLKPEEHSHYYEATMTEIKPSRKETLAMSSISTLVASGSKKIQPALRTTPAFDSLITAKATVHKASVKKKPASAVIPAAPTKSMGGLQKKLDALSKKYPGVTFAIQTLKTKQNQVTVSGIGKMTQNDLYALFKKIPNTHHIPNKMAAGTATFTLFGKKELTGAEHKPHHPSDPHIDKLEALRKVMNAAEFAWKKSKTPAHKEAYRTAKENYMKFVKALHPVTASARSTFKVN